MEASDDQSKTFALLPSEVAEIIRFPSIATITFFDGEVRPESLKSKLVDIICKNPWLCGRLIKGKNSPVALSVPSASATPEFSKLCETAFEVVDNDKLEPGVSYGDLFPCFEDKLVKPGYVCVNKDEPLFKVIFVRLVSKNANDRAAKRTAIVVSMSHVIADGHTFYSIYSMLSNATVPTSLIPFRLSDLEARVFLATPSLGPGSRSTWPRSVWFIIGVILNLLFRRRFQHRMLIVNDETVRTMKKEYADDVKATGKTAARATASANGTSATPTADRPVAPFLSTNDILVSWLSRTLRPRVLMMVVDLRNRIRGVEGALAGNYNHSINYVPDDASRPALIRESLSELSSISNFVPNWNDYLSGNVTVVSNWSTFYSELIFDGAKEVLHLPLLSLAPITYPIRGMGVIFKATKDKTGFLLFLRGYPTDIVGNDDKLVCEMKVDF